ncbi:MAG: aldo/keto reductase [bacterium]|nr:aldo/keto reductase [bacterium]
MELRPLGNSGTLVSELGLGTMTFGNETDVAGAHDQLNQFIEAGGTFVDTADVYTRGASESIVGTWLKSSGLRGSIVLTTKGRFPMSDNPLDSGASRRHLLAAIDASLDRLGVDYVDLYQVHGWDPQTPLAETVAALDTMVQSGRTRYVGWSNVTAWQMQRIVDLCERDGLSRPITLQPQYNLLDRTIEFDIMPMCITNGLGLLPWSPLGGGWLTGKYRADQRPQGATRLGEDPNRGVEAYDKRNVDSTWRVLAVVEAIAKERNVSVAQVALAWVRGRPNVSSVLLGARTVEQLADNLASVEVVLSETERDRLNEVSAPGLPPYPHGMIRNACGETIWDDIGTL